MCNIEKRGIGIFLKGMGWSVGMGRVWVVVGVGGWGVGVAGSRGKNCFCPGIFLFCIPFPPPN